jgi:hypothetical protein
LSLLLVRPRQEPAARTEIAATGLLPLIPLLAFRRPPGRGKIP